MHSKKQQNAD